MNRKCRTYVLLFLIILVPCSSCIQPARLPQIIPLRPSDYAHFEDRNHFRVAVQPYVEKAIVENSFGVDLLESSILPVLIVVENEGPQDFLLQTSDFRITPALTGTETSIQGGNETASPIETKSMLSDQNVKTAFNVGIITISPAVALPLVILSPFMDYHNRSMVEVSANIRRESLTDRIVYRGESHHGFIYLKFNGDGMAMSDCVLTAEFRALKSKSVLTFKFPIQMNNKDLRERVRKERRTGNDE